MAVLVTLQNYRAAAFPVEETTYTFTDGMVPRVGEYVHLHDQSRLAKVDHVIYMATDKRDDGGSRGCAAVVLVVTGTDPDRPWSGRYS